jgi:hypothetical protein
MSEPVDPAERDPSYDWRSEVNWPHVRRLIRWHALYWAFGATQAALYWAGMLVGVTRTLIGVADYLAWAVLLVMSFRVISRPRGSQGSAYMVSPRTFLVLGAFLVSLCAFIVLLSLIGLDTVELG